MKVYKILIGRESDISSKVNEHISDNWELVGGLTSATEGSIIKYAQAVSKDIEEVKPVAKRRKAK